MGHNHYRLSFKMNGAEKVFPITAAYVEGIANGNEAIWETHCSSWRGGKKGGAAGGKAVASKMTQEELRARSLKRLAARWGKKKSG
ncbi:MAG: hypothetical protein DMG58_17115 [Acidobacteria bacterium]|nr:MAG: hypothetical protein DMG58_17115 [Acidobacteriota bacterium]